MLRVRYTMHIVSKCHCVLITFVFPALRSDTEPLVFQCMYVFHDRDKQYLYCGVDIVLLYNFYVLQLLMIGILCLYHSITMFKYVCYFCQIFALHHFCFCLFSRCSINIIISKGCCFMYTHKYTCTHAYARTHTQTQYT